MLPQGPAEASFLYKNASCTIDIYIYNFFILQQNPLVMRLKPCAPIKQVRKAVGIIICAKPPFPAYY